VLIRDQGSLLYYKQSGKWVPDEAAAADFKTVEAAKGFLEGKKHMGVDIVMRFADAAECAPDPEDGLNPDRI
jgi:hypothetical protein